MPVNHCQVLSSDLVLDRVFVVWYSSLMTETLLCPECQTGECYVTEMETEVTIIHGNYIPGQERRELRPCTVVACSACEFIREIDPKTYAIIN